MRVLMLGWEFPPFISGGLGTACYGLTKALSRHQIEVVFVLPKNVASHAVGHVRLLSPEQSSKSSRNGAPSIPGDPKAMQALESAGVGLPGDGLAGDEGLRRVTFRAAPVGAASPYQSAGGRIHSRIGAPGFLAQRSNDPDAAPEGTPGHPLGYPRENVVYAGDLIDEARRYAHFCVQLAAREQFDIVHAHDWLTYPAGLAVAAVTGKPLVVHVHSTEFDRAGENVHDQVYDIERRGMLGAMRVICVSHLTKSIIQHRYGVDPAKIDVVYNGIDSANGQTALRALERNMIRKGDKIVLFLGRITMQKGPEYFVAAARKVLEKFDSVKFVMAGSGDKIEEIIELADAQGISHKILFTGFLRGNDVEKVFRMADVYVMPSVSEPFGIAPLEAISHDVPVIISKQSGVAEVLTHALKVDFWDVDEIANKIIAVLKHPPLSTTLRQHADIEVRKLTWDDAARRCQSVYDRAIEAMPS